MEELFKEYGEAALYVLMGILIFGTFGDVIEVLSLF